MQYRNRKTREEAVLISKEQNYYNVNGEVIHRRFIEDSLDWVGLDYEILRSCPIEGDIYSVKRLLDNEIFTVGDKGIVVPEKISNFYKKKSYLIHSFYIKEGELLARIENGCHIKLQDLRVGFTYTEEEMVRALNNWSMCKVEIESINKFLEK